MISGAKRRNTPLRNGDSDGATRGGVPGGAMAGGGPRRPLCSTNASVAVIGAGGSGLAMAKALREAGIGFQILEKADEVGGTWRDNTYPGLVVDVPGSIMALSFEPDTGFARLFPTAIELQQYVIKVAHTHRLREHVQFKANVVEARWDGRRWQLETQDGRRFHHEFVVHATGLLHNARIPDLPGLSSFQGQAFHSSRWQHHVAIEGRRVGVIGSGSSGVQIVGALAGSAAKVVHFARTPQWLFPTINPTMPWLLRKLLLRSPRANAIWVEWLTKLALDRLLTSAALHPGAARNLLGWAVRRRLRSIGDPALRRRLTPSFAPLCKRPVFSANYYQVIQRSDVELVDAGIERVEPHGIQTVDGSFHELDVLVLATGYEAQAYMRPMRIYGRDGVSLDDVWARGPRAYNTVAVQGFPNMFMLMGPHSPLVANAIWNNAERQARYVTDLISELLRRGIVSCAPTDIASDRWYSAITKAMSDTVWGHGCRSWYTGPDGVAVNWPFTRREWLEQLAAPDLGDYEIETDAVPTPGTAVRGRT